ncbi:hypothetical protein D0T49_04450 [Paludibacter sp. 221]|uniref:hypothetical protein n=1 Tax=Paludibacter sp. 221 TaxID=2302939 RepID=UPI0013D0E9A7|nr:hypothetical protein [Paludibacter sp. 221]NDV46287.1 hypothetical protein [Paludibacter sp. 221]
MHKDIIFKSSNKEYHATAWYDEDGLYDCTECYTFNEECDESIDVDWKRFKEEIEIELNIIPLSVRRDYRGMQATYESLYKVF